MAQGLQRRPKSIQPSLTAGLIRGSLVLKEKSTRSVVRLQTSNPLLRETFWNHYHNRIK